MDSRRRGLFFDEFEQGLSILTPRRTISEADIVNFAGLSGDFNPLHMDEEFARTTPHGGRIAHGMLSAAVSSGLAALTGIFDGTVVALLEVDARFVGVVRAGDTVQLELEFGAKKKAPQGDSGLVVLKTTLRNQRSEVVSEGKWKLLVRCAGAPSQ
ncbi:MaoC family dehydratase N-terminal domain-containing protein [Candidatus Fermentibacteria bacterium]|nr:MaoC family dehydratase N-terminal domain-containing protein [Candidatus Fermentibacteria bacterium]